MTRWRHRRAIWRWAGRALRGGAPEGNRLTLGSPLDVRVGMLVRSALALVVGVVTLVALGPNWWSAVAILTGSVVLLAECVDASRRRRDPGRQHDREHEA